MVKAGPVDDAPSTHPLRSSHSLSLSRLIPSKETSPWQYDSSSSTFFSFLWPLSSADTSFLSANEGKRLSRCEWGLKLSTYIQSSFSSSAPSNRVVNRTTDLALVLTVCCSPWFSVFRYYRTIIQCKVSFLLYVSQCITVSINFYILFMRKMNLFISYNRDVLDEKMS